jgi:hypothetical protein
MQTRSPDLFIRLGNETERSVFATAEPHGQRQGKGLLMQQKAPVSWNDAGALFGCGGPATDEKLIS